MTDLEQTDELPQVAAWRWPKGPMHVLATPAAALRRQTETGVLVGLDMAAGPDQTEHAVRTASGYKPVSALFAAAIGLLRSEPDQLAALCKLADAFPKATLAEVCQTLREVAVMLHVAEVGRSSGA